MEMFIQLELFASLREFSPPDPNHFPITPGKTVEDVLKKLGVPLDAVRLVFINGVKNDITTVLQGGERVGIFPPIGGG